MRNIRKIAGGVIPNSESLKNLAVDSGSKMPTIEIQELLTVEYYAVPRDGCDAFATKQVAAQDDVIQACLHAIDRA